MWDEHPFTSYFDVNKRGIGFWPISTWVAQASMIVPSMRRCYRQRPQGTDQGPLGDQCTGYEWGGKLIVNQWLVWGFKYLYTVFVNHTWDDWPRWLAHFGMGYGKTTNQMRISPKKMGISMDVIEKVDVTGITGREISRVVSDFPPAMEVYSSCT